MAVCKLISIELITYLVYNDINNSDTWIIFIK